MEGWNQIEGLISLSKDAEDIKRMGIIETLGMWHIFSLVSTFFDIALSPFSVHFVCVCVHVHVHVCSHTCACAYEGQKVMLAGALLNFFLPLLF